MKSLLLRPIQAVTLVFALTLTVAFGALAATTWLNLSRIETIDARVARTQLLQQTRMLIREEQLRVARNSARLPEEHLDRVRTLLSELPVRGGPIGPFTRGRIAELDAVLHATAADPALALAQAGAIVDRMLQREHAIQSDLLDSVREDTLWERRLALSALLVFPCLAILTLWALRQRVFAPLGRLRMFLSRLAEGDFTPVAIDRTDAMLRPLLENYNTMVARLAQLEESNRKRTISLTEEVHAATRTLLSQQQRLTRAERLAAAGEISASLAHELRNPIYGIHVTLFNLRKEIANPEVEGRLDLVLGELQRVTRLLNGLLQQSSHLPEAARAVEVDKLVGELAGLLRYQIPAQIALVTELEPGLRCTLPEDALRQALLNLVFNSVQALRDAAGTITIRADRTEESLRIEVSDDGPGFPEALLANGIRPFASFREDGTGLGLAIVKRFARDLGGELTISNRRPHGAVALITLPVHGRDAAADRG